MRVYTHPDCLRHDPGPHHPEAIRRLVVLLERLDRDGRFAVLEAEPAPVSTLSTVHPESYLGYLAGLAARGGGALDPDTMISAGSWAAARAAAGACVAAVASALAGQPAFAAVRPPGHHALAARGMGFCLLANAVLAARSARAAGAERVLIVDWDVHHGNGTQALVEGDPGIHFVSLHQWPLYPGTGRADERGVGNIFNVPMAGGLPPDRYVEALWSAVERAAGAFEPDLVLVSAGFDSMDGDPLGGFTLQPAHYGDLTGRLRSRFPRSAFASVLEGGYAPDRLAEGVIAHLTAA